MGVRERASLRMVGWAALVLGGIMGVVALGQLVAHVGQVLQEGDSQYRVFSIVVLAAIALVILGGGFWIVRASRPVRGQGPHPPPPHDDAI